MLTTQEEDFIQYWEERRTQKRSPFNYTLGLRLGAVIVILLLLNVATGWDKRATMVLRSNSSLILVILIASIGIIVFMAMFSAKYQWEQKEQQYKELLAKKNAAAATTN